MKNTDPVFFVNSFADRYSGGNPAAVVILDEYPEDSSMLALSREFGFSETAFLKQLGPAHYHIRWFTPKVEVPLCGHATLAAAKALFATSESGRITFASLSGELAVSAKGEMLELDFPAEEPEPCPAPDELLKALGPDTPDETLCARRSRNLILVYPEHRQIAQMKPDFTRLASLPDFPWLGIAVTAPCPEGYICRYFAPWEGIPEDPVTGSAQTFLAPYWSARLGLRTLKGLQASERQGTFEAEVAGGRVLIRGRALLWLRGGVDPGWRKVSG
ncbi:MAG: PhzF family phenazine biosynthesis protein [Candidatus Cloacimonetes bacterium]|nr:PhzF family phenazine biosynthesis protein [Candidatus Cloacimonadota bacterium]